MNGSADSGGGATPALERVAAVMRGPVESYVAILREVIGARLRSLTLYGAVLDGSFNPRNDSADSVLVVDGLEPALLRRLADRGQSLGRLGFAAPLTMTPEHIGTSLDTFPLEFIEIAQRHATVVGADPFSELAFVEADVRLQCEREVKRLLIGLRQGLLATAGRQRLMPSLERDAASALMRTLRGVRWLRGQKEFMPTEDVVTAVEKIAGRRLEGLRTALDRSVQPGWEEFEKLYHDVEAVGGLVHA